MVSNTQTVSVRKTSINKGIQGPLRQNFELPTFTEYNQNDNAPTASHLGSIVHSTVN